MARLTKEEKDARWVAIQERDKRVALKVKTARKQRGWSQQELAEKCGANQAYRISQIECSSGFCAYVLLCALLCLDIRDEIPFVKRTKKVIERLKQEGIDV